LSWPIPDYSEWFCCDAQKHGMIWRILAGFATNNHDQTGMSVIIMATGYGFPAWICESVLEEHL
jgi:hypothetical protein